MRVNEIFYSLQGEGAHTGMAVVFLRLSGCNLKCDFCDTKHEVYKEYTEEEIIAEIAQYPCKWVVITGGEPTLQLTESLCRKIHDIDKKIAIETNGTRNIPLGVDWVTVSPKSIFCGYAAKVALKRADEIKVVIDGEHTAYDYTFGIKAKNYYIQPCDTGNEARNKEIIDYCINFVKENPIWKLSLQTQKILNVR